MGPIPLLLPSQALEAQATARQLSLTLFGAAYYALYSEANNVKPEQGNYAPHLHVYSPYTIPLPIHPKCTLNNFYANLAFSMQ
ncbi:hypothetical protein ALTERO38_51822 [Alteromonas sp. 38]|nr:hypothetical protein ALTER154_80371 [Alteromonas sp. 154]VXB88386.1 hypothetical protein ALTERO38_51822 [Alteromonas sp. 38]